MTAEPFYANLPQVQSWLRPFCAQLKADYPNVFLLGEAASANVNLAVDYTAPDRGLMDSVVTFRYFTDSKAGLDPICPNSTKPISSILRRSSRRKPCGNKR